MSITKQIRDIEEELPEGVTLVVVSKTHPVEALREAYDAGARVFGESRPQEMCAKQAELPGDIQWHMIGHLQRNKVRGIVPFVSLIHSADSQRLLETVDKEAAAVGRTIDVLLEVHVAREESKSGWKPEELLAYLGSGAHKELRCIRFRGVMGIASNTDDTGRIKADFLRLREIKEQLAAEFFTEGFDTLSIGMTSDYRLAVECGSTMVRIGSRIFGDRTCTK